MQHFFRSVSASLFGFFFCMLMFAERADAQATSSVSGPNLTADDDAAEYRIGFAEVSGPEGDWAIEQRLSLQNAISDRFRIRGILQLRKAPGEGTEFSHVEADLLWQHQKKTTAGYASAIRLDVRATEGNRPNRVGLNWLNQIDFAEDWRARGMLSVDREFGPNASDGAILEARANISRKIGDRQRISLDSYHKFGNTDVGLGSFDDQEHLIGPTFSHSLTDDWDLTVGALAGISESAPDTVLQFRLARSLN